MKKLNKILLGGLICTTSFVFASNVKAESKTTIFDELARNDKVEYQVYDEGRSISYNKTYHYECRYNDPGCDSYWISEDDGKKDGVIKLTNASDTFYVNKEDLADGYVISANKNVEIYFSEEKKLDEFSVSANDITKIKYFKYYDSVSDMIKNANKYDNFYLGSPLDKDYFIPSDVTVTTRSFDATNIVNNGKIKAGYISAKKITGTGNIDLFYNLSRLGDGPINDTPVDAAMNFDVENVSGVKVNVLNANIKEGMSFGFVGTTTGYTKEEAQSKIDMYNKVLGSSMNGYELKLSKYKVYGADEYYYGVLAKKEVKTTTKNNNELNSSDTKNTDVNDVKNDKKEVKNPSTSDATNITAIILMISGAIAAITFKKVKQR